MLDDIVLMSWVMVQSVRHRIAERWGDDDRGEGVISTAIAVLIVAFLGAAAYVIFDQVIQGAGENACDQVNEIGNGGTDCK